MNTAILAERVMAIVYRRHRQIRPRSSRTQTDPAIPTPPHANIRGGSYYH
ncbi:hypothetical protein [Rhizobium leguminosarum]|nr:hypothetical protein [Rhizobium leguminosarum]WFT91054.1 hypothetical protein QA638_38920 [Rhizobium leguminosarum]